MAQFPGFSGVSGTVTGDEKGGSLELASRQVAVDMPSVFAEPRMQFDTLSAKTSWQAHDGRIFVDLKKAEFQNHDAAGEISGSYRTVPDGLGEIDVSAELKRAAGPAVCRYMPLAVGQNVRDWLQARRWSAASPRRATLRLKGDLAKFPFRDGKDGIFQVKGRFRGAVLRYRRRLAGDPRHRRRTAVRRPAHADQGVKGHAAGRHASRR